MCSFYEGHKAAYVQSERVRIAHILVPDEQAAANVQHRLAGGESFEEIAKELSEDTATRENGGEIQRWIERTSTGIPELGEVPGIINLVFSTEAESIVEQPITSDINRHLRLKSPMTQIKKPGGMNIPRSLFVAMPLSFCSYICKKALSRQKTTR